jgi:anti-sigma factor RsiW
MECKKVVRMMDRYIRKEMDAIIAIEIDAHLENCQACTEELETQEALHQLLTLPLEPKASVDFTSAVMEQVEKIHRKSQRSPVFYHGWGRSLVAAGILMMMINMAGISKNFDYEGMLYKTSAIQKNIVFSMDEVNQNISRIFNNIDMRIWRD